ncbi:D-alanyl-D-alanine carboxypeptidase family protein [Spongorhabdus nitratireducens]
MFTNLIYLHINMFRITVVSFRLLCFTVFLFFFSEVNAQILNLPVPQLKSKAWIIVDDSTGRTLASFNPNLRLPPASLTKIMTSYIVGDKIRLGEVHPKHPVKVSQRAWAKKWPGSAKMFLEPEQKVSLEQVNQGMITVSGNDAATAIAEHISGSCADFVKLMNGYAVQLGMTDTHYVNPHGLDDPAQYTTARDLALLCSKLIHDLPDQYKHHSQRHFSWNNISQLTRNSLLWDKELKVDGIKTGYTNGAGYSLASSAIKDGRRLIAIVLGTESAADRINESRKLLRWGYQSSKSIPVTVADTVTASAEKPDDHEH